MSIKVILESGDGSGRQAAVSKAGELAVSPIAYDDTQFNELAEPNTGYNFYAPKPKQQFIITGIIAYADKQVSGTTNATVVIFEAADSSTTTVDKVLMQFEIGQNQLLTAIPLRIKVRPGKWVNAKTDDDDVHTTITGYYIDQLDDDES